MVETREKYDFKSMIDDIKIYHLENDFSEYKNKQIEEILYKLNNIDSIVENIDEDILDDKILSDYNNCKNYVRNFINGNDNYITYIVNSLDTIFSQVLKYLDFNMMLGNRTEIKRYIREYKTKITKQSGILETEIAEIKNLIKEKTEEVNNENSELNDSVKKFEEELEKLKSEKELLKQSIDTMLDNEKSEVEQELSQQTSNLSDKYNEITGQYAKKFTTLSDNYIVKFDELLLELQAKEKQVSKLVGIVGTKSKIGEYKQNADSARNERYVWQFITICLFLISFGIMIYVTFVKKDYDKFIVFKYIVSAILMGAAAYTAKQASNCRKDEVYYRKQQLELASIDVYLETMEPDSREEIKKNLSDKIFGQAKNTYTNKYDESRGISIDDLIKLVDVIKK